MSKTFSLAGLLVLATTLPAADRPAVVPGQAGRSVTIAPHGMVATSHPLAAQIGLDILKAGGNAVDAAIATNAAIGLMEPMSNGIGGDLFAIVWDARTQKLYGLNANGRAPLKATLDVFKQKGLAEIPTRGPLSWSVPGCVGGWDALRSRFGSLPFKTILDPTIRYARGGVPIPEVIAGYWKAGERILSQDPGSTSVYLVFGDLGPNAPRQPRAPHVGELFKNPALANTLSRIAELGADGFYKGPVAEKMVDLSDKLGGLFTLDDFNRNKATWVEPVSTSYRGYDVWELPPPGQGIAALQMLNTLERSDLKGFGASSADWWHAFAESKKLAYADRAKYYADPEFAKVPVGQLISKEYAAERAKKIDPKRAMADVAAGDVKLGQADTIYLCVVDKDRNCVSLIQSNYNGFGSGITHPDLGFAIQNRGCLFALDPNHANRLEPGKRPFHTIIPAMVTKGGKPWLTFGVMGGDMQPQGHVQILVNLIDFGMNLQAAGEAPRVEHVGSATPTGKKESPLGGILEVEPGISDAVIKALESRGHKVRRVKVNGGGYQAILIDPATGMLHGASEYRKDGAAVGY